MVAEFKKTKSTSDELERHIEGLQKQLAVLRERERERSLDFLWKWRFRARGERNLGRFDEEREGEMEIKDEWLEWISSSLTKAWSHLLDGCFAG